MLDERRGILGVLGPGSTEAVRVGIDPDDDDEDEEELLNVKVTSLLFLLAPFLRGSSSGSYKSFLKTS